MREGAMRVIAPPDPPSRPRTASMRRFSSLLNEDA